MNACVCMYQHTSLPTSSSSFFLSTTVASTTSGRPANRTMKIMVVGGHGNGQFLDDVELVDPVIDGSQCHDALDYPQHLRELTGTMLNAEDAIFCGGQDSGKCYVPNTYLNVFRKNNSGQVKYQ